jgi:hypothetical protein
MKKWIHSKTAWNLNQDVILKSLFNDKYQCRKQLK